MAYRRQCLICRCRLYKDERGSSCADCDAVRHRISQLHKGENKRLAEQPAGVLAERERRLAEYVAKMEEDWP